MKKILLVLILFLPIVKIDALCTYSDLAYLKKLASNISYSYKYISNDNGVTFSVTLTNLQSNLYVVDKTKNLNYNYTGSELTIDNYTSGQVVKYDIYTTNGDCTDQVLYSIAFTLPTYNPYYNDSLCTTIPNYELCQKWSTHGLSYDKFKESVNEYLEYLKTEGDSSEKKDVVKTDNVWTKILKVLLDYYYIPLILIILTSSIMIYIINRKSNIYN